MKSINYIEIPAKEAGDANLGKSTWRDGRLVAVDEGTHVTLYVGHTTKEMTDEDGDPSTVTFAFPVRVEKPLTKDKAINAAEMEAYGLSSPMDVAALNAALSRKWRENMNDTEVSDHDEFIRWVKQELDSTGLLAKSSDKTDPSLPTLEDMLTLSRLVARKPEMLTDTEALSVKTLYPAWETFIGKKLEEGDKVQYNGGLWKVIQEVPIVLEHYPPSKETSANYVRIDEEHAGTLEDPIPYAPPMELFNGKYYTQDGVKYLCNRDSGQALSYNLSELVGLYVELVE